MEFIQQIFLDGGCTESPQATVKTDSTNPEGLNPPIATPISQRYVSLAWSKPLKPNGPISKFELLRMTIAQPLIGLIIYLFIYTNTLPKKYSNMFC